MKIVLTKNVLLICLIAGLVLTVVGAILALKVFPGLVENKIWEQIILKEDTEQWKHFKKIPFPFTVKIYFFNVENPNGVLQGDKPILTEVGPYVYKSYRWREDITWQDDDISYYEYLRFEFDDLASGRRSDTDKVTILNSAVYAFLLAVEEASPESVGTVDSALGDVFHENSQIFSTVAVKDLLFDGLPICRNWGEHGGFIAKMICKQVKEKAAASKPMRVVDDSVLYATLYYKNNTHQGRFTIKSGQKNRDDVGKLIKYEYDSYLSIWDDEKSLCNKIRGVVMFPPYVDQNKTFDTFGEDICRVVTLEYQQTETVKGIEGYRFVAKKNTFHSPEHNKDNVCFCSNTTKTVNGSLGCLKDGLMDMTKCMGAPVLLSFPHLLHADKSYFRTIKGLHPNHTLHENFVTLEPYTGVPLRAAKRVQFNMFLRPITDVSSLENATATLVPMFWLEEGVELPDDFTDVIKYGLLFKLKMMNYFKWSIIGIGIAIFVVTFVLIIKKT